MSELNKDNDFYNFIIVGAGPAGLTASIVATRLGLSAICLEKGEITGPKPRGEGMAHVQVVDEILGRDFLPSVGSKSNGGRVWHSPGDQQTTITHRTYDHYFFEWREFIDRFEEIAHDLDVNIQLNCEVISPIEKDRLCMGVKYRDGNGNIKEVHGNCVLDCSGHSGIIGRHYNIAYDEEMNCPIIKCLISEANIDINVTPDLQFYFIGNGDLEYSKSFPQCVAYVFPLGNKKAEVGLMLRMAQARNMKTVKIPSDKEIMNVWNNLKSMYPGFK
ncbi:MAG: FAD-dependent oxidoreductase, partial [Promethearchaeota archaeon]